MTAMLPLKETHNLQTQITKVNKENYENKHKLIIQFNSSFINVLV